MMALQRHVCFFSVFFTAFVLCLLSSSSHAYHFKLDWSRPTISNPNPYVRWAATQRFLINDTLLFKNKNGSDYVLVVSKSDYDKCVTKNPIERLNGTESMFVFDRSGPFYFITGNHDSCVYNQKMVVVVLAIRNHKKRSSPITGAPVPAVSPPKFSPISPVAETPYKSSPVPATGPSSPTGRPLSPASPLKPPAVSPSSPSPVLYPAPLYSPSGNTPAKAPTSSPPKFNTSAPAYSPSASTPATAPTSQSPSPFSTTPPPLYSPPGNAPATAPTSLSPMSTTPAPATKTPANAPVFAETPSMSSSPVAAPGKSSEAPGGSSGNLGSPSTSSPTTTSYGTVFNTPSVLLASSIGLLVSLAMGSLIGCGGL